MAANPTIDELTKLLAKQQKLVEQLLNAQQTNVAPTQTAQLPALSNVECFDLDDHSGKNIESWIDRFVLALDCSSPNIQDQLKVKLVLTKLSEGAYNEYSKYCLPKKPTDFDFSETSAQLKSLFAKPQSVWIDRYECLRASKQTMKTSVAEWTKNHWKGNLYLRGNSFLSLSNGDSVEKCKY